MTVGSIRLKNRVKLLDVSLGNLVHGMIDDIVDTTEVIDSLNYIIYRCILGGNAKSVGLEDISCLLFCQTTTLNMIGVICKVNLRAMIYSTLQSGILFLTQSD